MWIKFIIIIIIIRTMVSQLGAPMMRPEYRSGTGNGRFF